MPREIRYTTTSDGVRIAYGEEGEGSLVVMTPLLVFESFVYEDISPEYRRFSSLLSERCRLVQYDNRGIGPSGGADDTPTAETTVRDLEAAIQAVGGGPVDLVGRAMGSIAAVQLAAEKPELVNRLALYAPLPTTESVSSPEEAAGIAEMSRANWEMAARMLAD